MADGQLRGIISQLRRLMGRQSGCTLTDAQLLADFVGGRDEAAFEVLVWRHATMVLSLCQRILHDSHEAEDAFQATFLVFARKAGSIGKGEAVSSWLYKVAYRVALRVRARTTKRTAREEPTEDLPAREATDEVLWRDLRPVLDEEIERLPEKYRTPFVLCYLQGNTNEEVAAQLGCPQGTILSRLSRGRERLRSRLARRGLALSAAGAMTLLAQNAATAAVPAGLVSSTVQAAVPFAAGKTVSGLVSASVATLADGVLHTMFLTKLKIAAALAALLVLGTGTGWLVQRTTAETPSTPEVAVERPTEKASEPAVRDDVHPAEHAGTVVAVAEDGSRFTLEIAVPSPQSREERPREMKRIEVRMDANTLVTYSDVGPTAARPTEGYAAQVELPDGTKDLAARVTFRGSVNVHAADVAGKVVGVARNGQSITLELAKERGGLREEAKRIEVALSERTRVSYQGVLRGGAVPTLDYTAQVWLSDGPGSPAVDVHFLGKDRLSRRSEAASLTGKVVAVTRDRKTITLEAPEVRGQAVRKFDVQLTDATTVAFSGVGPNAAEIVEGLQAQVWLAADSRDRAEQVYFVGARNERDAQLSGKVVGVAADGRSFTLEATSRDRNEAMKRFEVKISERTRVVYSGVGPDGAKPTKGYSAQVRWVEGSTDTAAVVTFSHRGAERGR